MKFTIETNDFWIDQDNLEESLKQKIIQGVVQQIQKDMKTEIENKVEKIAKEKFEDLFAKEIEEVFKDVFENEEIRFYGNQVGSSSTCKEYILKNVSSTSGYNPIKDSLKKQADLIAVDLKKRYDLQFAAHIVNKLSEQGMLKDDELLKLLP